MKSSLRCVVLLACVVVCTSIVIKRCLCLTTRNRDHRRIVAIKERPPRPYCSRYEVIAKLETGGSLCLNPRSNFTVDVVRTFRKRKEEAARTSNLNDTGRQTTTTSTVLK